MHPAQAQEGVAQFNNSDAQPIRINPMEAHKGGSTGKGWIPLPSLHHQGHKQQFDFFDLANLQAICKPCHDIKTAEEAKQAKGLKAKPDYIV